MPRDACAGFWCLFGYDELEMDSLQHQTPAAEPGYIREGPDRPEHVPPLELEKAGLKPK